MKLKLTKGRQGKQGRMGMERGWSGLSHKLQKRVISAVVSAELLYATKKNHFCGSLDSRHFFPPKIINPNGCDDWFVFSLSLRFRGNPEKQ